MLDEPSLRLQLHGRTRSRRTLRDEKHFPVQLDGELVKALDRALFERLQSGPEVRRVLDRAPDAIAMTLATPAAVAGASIVASCRSDRDTFVAVLFRFACFRRRAIVLGQAQTRTDVPRSAHRPSTNRPVCRPYRTRFEAESLDYRPLYYGVG